MCLAHNCADTAAEWNGTDAEVVQHEERYLLTGRGRELEAGCVYDVTSAVAAQPTGNA